MATLLGQLVRRPSRLCSDHLELERPHPPEFSISKSLARPMDIITNSFCAVRGSALFAFGSLLEPDAGWERPWKRNLGQRRW